MDEKIFFQAPEVLVSSSRVEISGQTFATRNIGSVKVTAPGVSIVAVLMLLVGAAAMAGSATGVGLFFLVVGAIWAYTTWARRELKLVAGGGEVLALKTTDRNHVEKIRSAIAEAISVR
ncbi:DUF6232 family protein [uncultured Ramlibacter sp.]|uniref:DUF6232 family protein n=1 Tax=uncultured Ramlibacter sp. TaxID=260755 RepID=UPI00263887FA|nr:DUF6232 family protein [uncultured Ramlibacter sp.]